MTSTEQDWNDQACMHASVGLLIEIFLTTSQA